LNQGLSGAATLSGDIDRVLEAERLGYDSVWTSESYGSDAVTTATWIAARTQRMHVGTAIMQMAGRTPAATAMTAMTLDSLSGGRFRLGLGVPARRWSRAGTVSRSASRSRRPASTSRSSARS
jgi:alkanesulfonate monooxygenase SsuD/methylene tetrahydromethanopterin reductase-like flavin-dependent oxidoreductase (luciferase family)